MTPLPVITEAHVNEVSNRWLAYHDARGHVQPSSWCNSPACIRSREVLEVLSALASGEVVMVPTDRETAFVIEVRNGRPDYWYGGTTWGTEHTRAVRFARKSDAETVIAAINTDMGRSGDSEFIAVGHTWYLR